MHRLSMDQIGTVVQVGVRASSVSMIFPTQMELKAGMYVTVVYDKWYVGCIADWSKKFEDVLVNCMHQCSTKNKISWPTRQDKCNIPFNHVLCSVPAPIPLGSSGRSYSIQDETIKKIEQCFKQFQD